MEVEFNVKIQTMDLYDFKLQHTYRQAVNIIVTGLGLFLVYGFISTHKWLYLVAAVIVVFYNPVVLLMKSFLQAKSVETFKNGLTYVLKEEGITVRYGEEENLIGWDSIVRACNTQRSIFLYTSKSSAFILPRKEMGERTQDALEMIFTHVDPSVMKIKY
ncbi:MAG: YcxB family protein [Lachnospiraceae bacterium]|nr:YcxB family protein [Lachnospiraceae bacterium]